MTQRELWDALAALLKAIDGLPDSAKDTLLTEDEVAIENARKIVAAGPIIDWDSADPDPQPTRVQE
jgi:hypothetical protein